jgi:hypothetical protein
MPDETKHAEPEIETEIEIEELSYDEQAELFGGSAITPAPDAMLIGD